MANVKAYSVAKTQKGFGSAVASSTVYSISRNEVKVPATGSPGYHCSRNGAYDHPDNHGLVEGRTPTLVKSDQAVVDHDVTDIANPTVNYTRTGMENTVVIATTRTVTGDGHGLIIQFDTTNTGTLPAFGTGGPLTDSTTAPSGNNFRIIAAGEGYDTNDIVEVDGWPGSRIAVTAQ